MNEILEALRNGALNLKSLLARFSAEDLNKAATAGLIKVKDSKDGYVVSLTAKGKKSLA